MISCYKKCRKYLLLAIILVACFGLFFTMYSASMRQSVQQFAQDNNLPDIAFIYGDGVEEMLAAEAATGSATISSYASSTTLSPGFNESASDDDYSAGGSGWIEVSKTGTYTITFSSTLATAISNGRLKATINATGTYRVNATSQGDSGNSTRTLQLGASGGLSGYAYNSTYGNGDSGTVTFTDKQVATGTLSSSSVVVRFYVHAKARWAGGNWVSWKYAYVNSDYKLTTVKVALSVNALTASYSSNNTSRGTVSPATSSLSAFSTTGSSTATAKTGYYFSGWTGTATANTRTITTNQLYQYSAAPSFTANFSAISLTAGTYTYNGSSQGPTATNISGYTFAHNYNGTANDGSSYNSSTKPTKAGNYSVTATLTRNSPSEVVGSKSIDFTIGRASSITLHPNVTNTISYGQLLNKAVINGNGTLGSENIAGSFVWVNGNEMPEISTTKAYSYKFTPNGTNKDNFNTEFSGTVAVSVQQAFVVTAIDRYTSSQGELWGNVFNTAIYNSNTKPINATTAQVSVTASPDASDNYVFLGWMKNGVYVTKEFIYTYIMPNDSVTELNATLKAVFVKIDVEGLSSLSYGNFKYDKFYTGTADAFNFTFSLPGEIYKFEYTPMVYTQGLGFPVAITSETATFTIRNTQLNQEVFSATILINIIENIVSVAVDTSNSVGYNALTGWGETIYYTISVPGVQRGMITKYQYRIEGESVWYDVINEYNAGNPTTTPQNQNGCPVRFMAGAGIVGESSVRKYHFKAVNNTHGTTPSYYGGNKSVASTESYTACKIDRMDPALSMVIVSNDISYTGNWTNGDVTFIFTASYGGSGAQINFSTNGTVYNNTGATPGYNAGDESQITEDQTYYWIVSTQQMSTPFYFNITTGTNKSIFITDPIICRIDKTKPNISDAQINLQPNINGWIGQSANATFSVSEGAGWSGIASISVDPTPAFTINGGSGINGLTNSCVLTVNDYREYTITATDNAGNVQTKILRYKVDTMVPYLSLEEGSYVANTWISTTANFKLLAEMGASGAKFYYRFGATSFILIGNDEFVYGEDSNAAFQNVEKLKEFSEAMNRNLSFKVVTGSGHETLLNFGVIKLDYTKPLIVSLTDMAYYNNNWLNDPVLVDFYTSDDASGINIESVTVNNGGEVLDNGTTIEGFPRFRFQIDKCTVYTVTVSDIAGNSTTYEFRAQVDIGIPEMSYEAFIGTTDEVYNFDKWINRSEYGDDAYVRFVFNMTISPSGAKIQYKDASDQWKDLTPIMLQAGHENELEQHVECEVDVRADQNGPYMIRLMTGSQKYTDTIDLGTVMIDSTLPGFSVEPVFTDAADGNVYIDDFQINWTYKVVKARFIPSDQTSGITSVTVFRYEISDPQLTNGTQITCQKEATTNYYSFIMDSYAYYELTLEDGSGNTKEYPLIQAMVDITDGFSLTVNAQKDGQPYESGNWMQSPSDIVNFQCEVIFDPLSGYTGFGPSGGQVQFSVDGGATWGTSINLPDGIQALTVDPIDPLKANMDVVY